MSWNSAGREGMRPLTSETEDTSSFTGWTWTPDPTSFWMSAAMVLSVSMRLAVRISLRDWGDVRANSKAVLRPMPEEAPVIRMVLPLRRLDTAEAIVRRRMFAIGELLGYVDKGTLARGNRE